MGVAWQMLSHFHRQRLRQVRTGARARWGLGSCQFWELGFPGDRLRGLGVWGGRGGWLPTGSGLPGVWLRAGVLRVTGALGAGLEHSRGAFQLPLSNAWLWYSSWRPLKHTQSGSIEALSPRTPPLKTGGSLEAPRLA